MGRTSLIDLNLLRVLLVERADLQPHDVVLEVGTGTGSLTAQMAPRVAAVVTVEIDPQIAPACERGADRFRQRDDAAQDALRNKNNLDEAVLERGARSGLPSQPERQFKLVANLPYSIATPVISNLLLTDITPVSMTVTIQKELAERIVARPGTQGLRGAERVGAEPMPRRGRAPLAAGGVLAAAAGDVARSCTSNSSRTKRARIADLRFFHDFVRSMFFHRRKFLRSVVDQRTEGRARQARDRRDSSGAGISRPTSRAEQLSVEAMIALCDAVRAALAGKLASPDGRP